MAYVPRYYQFEAVDSVFFYYASGKDGNPVVAMPTASGKSLVIAEFIKTTLMRWPRQRIICATHVKELIVQNAEKIRAQWPQVPLGINSAGLNQRDVNFPVVYAGIASIIDNIKAFGHRDLLLVDEAHLIGSKESSMYLKAIKALKETNPNLKVIGFTATPYRSGMGLLTEGDIFTDICYDLTTMEAFNRLISEGYLSLLIPKQTKVELDVSNVKVIKGEFDKKSLAKAVDTDPLTLAACREVCELGWDRKSWLGFASSVKHAEHVAAVLQHMGIDAIAVHSKMPMKEADKRLADFRKFKYRAIINYGKLTTGFDHPAIDLIAMLRPTMSTVLWVQMLGRGMRPSPDTQKENCLVLDFARNTERLGPVNDPLIPRKRKPGQTPGVAPVRICEKCGVYNHAKRTFCIACGHIFTIIPKLEHTAGTQVLIRTGESIVETFNVDRVIYNKHHKSGLVPSMRVQYFCNGGLRMFSEYISFESTHQWAKKIAAQWWMERAGAMMAPPTVDDALAYTAQLRAPKRITVLTSDRYPQVKSYEY